MHTDVQHHSAPDAQLRLQVPDGKPANRYAYDAKALCAEHAQKVVAETHEFYLRLKAGTQPNADRTTTAA